MAHAQQNTTAQDTTKPVGYQFTDIKRLPATSVKDQYRAGHRSWPGRDRR